VDTLDLPGFLCDFILTDFEGDQSGEVVALGCSDIDSLSTRWGAIFGIKDDRFESSPRTSFDIPSEAVVFDAGDIDGDGSPEILYLASDGLYAMEIDGIAASRPRLVIKTETMFLFPTPKSVSHWDFYKSTKVTGQSIILIPAIDVIRVYDFENGAVSGSHVIPFKTHGHASRARIAENRAARRLGFDFDLPFIDMLDYNGDGINDLYVINDDGDIDIFTRSFDGDFSRQPAIHMAGAFGGDSNAETEVLARDINGDGLGDLVVSRYTGGVKNLESKIEVYLCKTRGGHNRSPAFEHTIPNSAGVLFLSDINHDGRSDIVITAIRIGMTAMLKMLILNRVDLGLEVFLQQPGGTFPSTPSMSATMAVLADLNSGEINFAENIAVKADFNGDSLRDFLIETGDGVLNIYYGVAGGIFETEPGWIYPLPKPSSILAEDCDNDGISEIFAFYNDSPTDRDIIRVVHVGAGK